MKTAAAVSTILQSRAFRFTFTAILIGALVYQSIRYGQDLRNQMIPDKPLYLLPALAVVLISLFLNALAWRSMVSALGQPIPIGGAVHIYFASILSRYLPGTYWYILSRAQIGSAYQVPSSVSVLSTGMEIAVKLAATLLVIAFGAVFQVIEFDSRLLPLLYWLLFGVACTILLRLVFQKRGQPSGILTPKGILNTMASLPKGRIASWLGFHLASSLTQGIALWLTLACWSAGSHPSPGVAVLSYAYGWLAGFINPLTPNGLGTREAVLVSVLNSQAAAPVVLAASLLMRILGILGEAAWAGVGLGYHKKRTAPAP